MKRVSEQFKVLFNEAPELFFAPGRINIIGEHTDYNDGFVMPAAIDKGIGVAITKSDQKITKVFALDVGQSHDIDINNVRPIENGGWRNYVLGVIGELQESGYHVGNFNLLFSGNIPEGAGMSSSAALENSIALALNNLFDLKLSKKHLIRIAQKAEHNYARVNCGIMDQYASMFGEKHSALLLDCRSMDSQAYQIDFKQYKLLLINTNVKHHLAESAYNNRRAVCEKVSKSLGVKALRDAKVDQLKSIENQLSAGDFQKALYIIEENQRVLDFFESAKVGNIDKCGALLFASHQGLSQQYQVSCEELDFLVDYAVSYDGVIGARMMGGGFGGCTINLVHEDKLKAYIKEVSAAYEERFDRSCSIYKVRLSEGARQIIL